MIFSFGTRIILLLIIVSAAIAYIGDYIGRSIGRKRLSFLKLRPRYTAIIFTVLTGILITLITISIILAVSQDARTAFFGLDQLKNTLQTQQAEIKEKIAEKEQIDQELEKSKKELEKSQKDINQLHKTKKSLEKEIKLSREGSVLFRVDDVLITSVIQAGPEKDKLESGLKQILSAADFYIRGLGFESDKPLIIIEPKDFNNTVALLQTRSGENIVKVVVSQNTLWGESANVRFEIEKNSLIYTKNEEIASLTIPANLSTPEIEQLIKQLLANTHAIAKEAGIVPGSDGSIGSIPYSEIFDLSKKIKMYNKGVILKTMARQKTFSIGPLEIDFKIYYQ